MEYDTSFPMLPTMLGVTDPRTEEGELLFEERFPRHVVDAFKHGMTPYEFAGQMQQTPIPKGGGIIQRAWWQGWEEDHFPELDYILASLDTAYGEKQENDYSAMTVWGVFTLSSKASEVATRTLSRAVLDMEKRKGDILDAQGVHYLRATDRFYPLPVQPPA